MKVENRTFVVSGGSSGLGLATVNNLLQANAYVAILDIAAPPTLESTADPSRTLYVKMDITKVDQVEFAVERVVAWTESTGAILGGVVNGAGVAAAESTINRRGEPHSTQTWDFVLGVNLSGTFHLTRLVAKHLVNVPREGDDGERGVIIMVASTVAYEGQNGQIAYAASKGAIRSMTLPLARDMARYGIRVVSLAPGPFKTPMTEQFSETMTTTLENEVMLFPKRYGAPVEFAETVRWVLETAYVNGETFKLTGGARVPAML